MCRLNQPDSLHILHHHESFFDAMEKHMHGEMKIYVEHARLVWAAYAPLTSVSVQVRVNIMADKWRELVLKFGGVMDVHPLHCTCVCVLSVLLLEWYEHDLSTMCAQAFVYAYWEEEVTTYNQVFTKKVSDSFSLTITGCTDCNTSICTPSRNRLVSSLHFNQFNAQNLRNVNRKCVENARKDTYFSKIAICHVLDGKSVHKKGFCLCHSFFNNILHFCTFSENDAQAFLDLYTNLMKNSQMVAFFVHHYGEYLQQYSSIEKFLQLCT
jgi:hypothetical protein